ncbi:MAG: hypothetical protein LBR71_00775 [Synergistaceae bacterium]|jgi:hypothetical protein|nr:hypothetical protein [Synergistaceae bacterium]
MFEAYATPEFADEYFDAAGNAAWPVTPPEESPEREVVLKKKSAALFRATMWIDGIGRGKWKGTKTSADQPLAWPRQGVTDEEGFSVDADSIPELLAQAVCEAAVREITGTSLAPDMERGGAIKQEVIGPISTTFMDNAPAGTRFPVIENLLSGLVKQPLFDTGKPVSGSVKIARA